MVGSCPRFMKAKATRFCRPFFLSWPLMNGISLGSSMLNSTRPTVVSSSMFSTSIMSA